MLRTLSARLPPALQQTLLYAFSILVAKGVSFVMVPVFTQFLSPEDYGRLDILQTLADLLSVVVGLGLADSVYRFAGSARGEAERRKATASIFGIAMASGLIFLAAGQIAAPWITIALPGGIATSETRLLLISLAASGLILVPLAWLRMNNRAGIYAIASAGRSVIQAGLATLMLVLGFGVWGVLLAGMIACMVLATSLALYQLRQTGMTIAAARTREHVAFGGPLVLAGAAAFVLGSCDRWILAAFVGVEAVAIYAVAVKFALIVAMAAQPFELWWLARRFPMLNGPDGEKRVAVAAGTGVVWTVLCGVGVAATAPTAIRLMTPEAYHAAASLAPWLCGIAVLHAVTGILNIGIYSGRTGWDAFRVEATIAVIALALYFLLIPELGVTGAILATAVAQVARLSLVVWLAQRRRRLPYRLGRLGLLLAMGGVAVAVIGQQTDPLSEVLMGTLALGIIAGSGLLLGLAPDALVRKLLALFPFLPGHLLAVDGRG